MCKAKSYIEQIDSIFVQVKNDLQNYKNELRKLEDEQLDLLHFIENESMSASRGYCLAKQLQEVRQKRRKVKLEIETLESLHSKFVNNNDKKVIEIKKVIDNREKALNSLIKNKIYHPRILKEAK